MMFSRKVIEIYVTNEEVPVGLAREYELISPGHECTRKPVTSVITEKVLPEVDKMALKVVEEVCKEAHAKFKVNNTSTFKGRIWARFKRIKITLAVIIGKNRIEGVPKKEQLTSLLK